jgi:hypothetical protein
MRRLQQAVIFLLLACLFPFVAQALSSDKLTVTPVVIDAKAKPRDVLKETITVTNTADHLLTLYPGVNNVKPEDGEQAFAAAQSSLDLDDSLANWIELSRGVIELEPGEQKEVPFIIHVNMNAITGVYHAQISFSQGTTRAEAEAAGPLATVAVNVEVQEDTKEVLQLGKFTTGKFFLAGDDVRFDYLLENIGNQELQPRGEIRVYDRKGQEVASVDVNKDGKAVSPDQMAQLASVWAAAEGFGQYKALLTVYYGKSQTASVQDTIFFWIVPWKQLLAFFILGLAGAIFAAFYFHRMIELRHARLHGVPVAAVSAAVAVPSVSSNTPHTRRAPRIPLGSMVRAVGRGAAFPFSYVKRLKRGEHLPVQREIVAPTVSVTPPQAPVPTYTASSGTIDLKNLSRRAPEQTVTESHVIDLKRR